MQYPTDRIGELKDEYDYQVDKPLPALFCVGYTQAEQDWFIMATTIDRINADLPTEWLIESGHFTGMESDRLIWEYAKEEMDARREVELINAEGFEAVYGR